MSCEPNLPVDNMHYDCEVVDLPDGVPPLRSLYLYIAGSCNLCCRHCWISPEFKQGGKTGPFLGVDQAKLAVREAKCLGLRYVKLTGGEPLLHPDFHEILMCISDENIPIILETNGTLVDKEMAKSLRSTRGMGFVSVSLDGATEQTHERLRCVPGSYQQAIIGIRNLVEVGLRPQLICTLLGDNASEVAQLSALAEELGCGSMKFNLLQQTGRGEEIASREGLAVGELLDLYERVRNEIRPARKIPIYFDVPLAFRPIRSLLNKDYARCAIKNILGILAGGEISLCGIGTTVPELVFGTLGQEALREVWIENPTLNRLRSDLPSRLEGVCGDCIHRGMCLASCVASNYHLRGSPTAPNEFCERALATGLFPATRRRQFFLEKKKS